MGFSEYEEGEIRELIKSQEELGRKIVDLQQEVGRVEFLLWKAIEDLKGGEG